MHIFNLSTAKALSEAVYQTQLEGVLFMPSKRHEDERGFFSQLSILPSINPYLPQPFLPVQINHSHSKKHVIRGFHAEDWNKLVTVISGECYCVVADFRPDSKTFGQSMAITLGTTDRSLYGSMFIPSGVGNSSLALSEKIEYLYFVDKLYADRNPAGDVAISLFDPDLAVPWPVDHDKLIYSQRDTQAIQLREKYPHKFGK